MPRLKLTSLLVLVVVTGALAHAQLLNFPELEPSEDAIATLQKAPPLIAGTLLSGFNGPVQIDELRYAVQYRDSSGATRELLCDRPEDGFRRTFPGTRRAEITSLCFEQVGRDRPTWTILTELEGNNVYVELFQDKPPQRLFAGTLLPSRLPNWLSDLAQVNGRVLWVAGKIDGDRGGYSIRLKISSPLPPAQFISAIKIAGQKTQNDESVQWQRSVGKTVASRADLTWTGSGSETIYTFTAASAGLNQGNNLPLALP